MEESVRDCGTPAKGPKKSGFFGIPSLESLLHARIDEERKANIALDWPVKNAGHIGALYDRRGGNQNLMAKAGRVRDASLPFPRGPDEPTRSHEQKVASLE
jgi:hypothetical protein